MPYGFECDRCGTFKEVEKFGKATPEGKVEQVVIHPPVDSDDSFAVNEYTLCERCRAELINEIESCNLSEQALADR